jgi:hypothetical protein
MTQIKIKIIAYIMPVYTRNNQETYTFFRYVFK